MKSLALVVGGLGAIVVGATSYVALAQAPAQPPPMTFLSHQRRNGRRCQSRRPGRRGRFIANSWRPGSAAAT